MWALVTGGAKRLGAVLCLALAERGYAVAVHYNRSALAAQQVVADCRKQGVDAMALQGDFSSIQGVTDFAQRYGEACSHTAVLINNVGGYLLGSARQTTVADWAALFQLNLHTPFILTQTLLPHLLAARGHIINIGVCGLHRQIAHVYSTAYTLTKQSLWALTLAYARELAPEGVRVNMVSPGELDISTDTRPLPMRRPADCGEVSRVVTFLLDPASGYITGQNIEVAGGLGLA